MLVVLATCTAARAAPAEPLLTPEQEAVARRVEEQLMAPCCFGGTVASHRSPAADAIRQAVRTYAARGMSDRQILEEYATLYGERILAQPVARGFNLLAYWMPAVGLLCGAVAILAWLRRHARSAARTALPPQRSADDQAASGRLRDQLEERLAALDA